MTEKIRIVDKQTPVPLDAEIIGLVVVHRDGGVSTTQEVYDLMKKHLEHAEADHK